MLCDIVRYIVGESVEQPVGQVVGQIVGHIVRHIIGQTDCRSYRINGP